MWILPLFSDTYTSLQPRKMVIIATAEMQAAIMALNLPCIKAFRACFRARDLEQSDDGTPGAMAYYRIPFLGRKASSVKKTSNGDFAAGPCHQNGEGDIGHGAGRHVIRTCAKRRYNQGFFRRIDLCQKIELQ